MIGRRLGHNRIVEKIGAGGMGEVYRGYDETLHRDVAIKVLPEGALGDESARRRFRKEALALSRLNHPNVESVYLFGREHGIDFLVMEFIPGRTLGSMLHSGPLEQKEVVRLAIQMADGLEDSRSGGNDRGCPPEGEPTDAGDRPRNRGAYLQNPKLKRRRFDNGVGYQVRSPKRQILSEECSKSGYEKIGRDQKTSPQVPLAAMG